MKYIFHALWVVILTVLTQIGGLAWLIALPARRRWLAFPLAYIALWSITMIAAPLAGRVPLPCWGDGALRVASPAYCLMNRHYAAPELAEVAQELAEAVDAAQPGTRTLALDAGFPFFDGFPLLPHKSHDNGRQLDFAFYYRDSDGRYLPGALRSPIGYFAFSQGPTDCLITGPSLRWNMGWLQPLFPVWRLEPERMRAALTWLAANPRVERIFIEPHIKTGLGLTDPKIGFQGCQAARHDDHFHIQIR